MRRAMVAVGVLAVLAAVVTVVATVSDRPGAAPTEKTPATPPEIADACGATRRIGLQVIRSRPRSGRWGSRVRSCELDSSRVVN